MRGRTVPVQLAHMPGACGVALSTTGNHFLTTGCDSTIRPHDISDTPSAWWRSESTEEPELEELAPDLHEKPILTLALSPSNRTAATGCDDGHVRIFDISESFDSATLVQACARFGGPVRAISFSPTGSFLAAAGDEPGVLKIIMTAQPSNVNVLRAPASSGQQAVVGIAYDPRSDFVACVGEKGEAIIWDVEKCKFVCLVELNKRKANCVTWTPDGESLVYGTDRGVVIVARDTWIFDCLLEDAGDKDDDDDGIFAATSGKDNVSAIAVSSNGRYLLAAREDSNISLWDLHDKKVLSGWKSEEVAQKILWHPTSNAFMLIDKIGQWGIIGDVVPPHMPAPQSDAHAVKLPVVPEIDDKPKKRVKDAVEDDDDDGVVRRSKGASRRRKQKDKKQKSGTEKSKRKQSKQQKLSDVEDEDQELENSFTFDASHVDADEEEKLRHERDDDDSEDSEESEEDSESDEELDGELADLENGGVRLPKRKKKSRGSHAKESTRRGRAPLVQKPYMPSSTPLSEKLQRKKHILCWNLVGAVISYAEDAYDIIEIEFAEASKRTVGVKDHFGYTMGCLSETGVFLASPKKKEHGGLITFRPFSSWANNSDWTQFLQGDESISSIALGQRFAAVATTPNNVIRILSLSGLQTSVFGVSGTVISTAARGDNLVVVYVEPDSAALKCELLEISSTGDVEKIIYSGCLMTCANATSQWIGFTSDTNELCSYDSKGWLWLMADPKNSRRWIPMMQDAAKTGECAWFWVASATSNHIVGVPCLSNERYPQAKPRPALRSLPLSAPVIDKVTKTGKPTVVERMARTKLRLQRAIVAKANIEDIYDSEDEEIVEAEEKVTRMELETDKCLLALMEDACKREQNMRALDLATRLHCKVSFKYATELAKHYKRTALATRVEQVALKKLMIIEDEEQNHRRKASKSRSSPVTPIAASRPNLRSDATPTTQKPRISRMDFGSDDEDPKLERALKSEPSARPVGVTGVNDVTDDEDEGEKTEPESKPDTPERNDEKTKPENNMSRKRAAPIPASQASVGGFVTEKSAETKKPRITDTLKGQTEKKRPFHNRFAKK